MRYSCVYYQWLGGASLHSLTDLDSLLNKKAEDGWMIETFVPISIGLLCIFKKSE